MKKVVLSLLVALVGLGFGVIKTKEDALNHMRKYGCIGCHDLNVRKVGPAYKDVAKKYRNVPGAVDKLVKKVKMGGAGVWGSVPMPPQAVPEAEERAFIEWILKNL